MFICVLTLSTNCITFSLLLLPRIFWEVVNDQFKMKKLSQYRKKFWYLYVYDV